MKNLLVITLFLTLLFSCKNEPVILEVTNLRVENKLNPLGVDIEKPRFSWNSVSEQRGVSQSAYHIIVATDTSLLNVEKADVWNTGKVDSDKSIQIGYEGNSLESNKKYFWKVIVFDQNGDSHESEISFWTTGLFKELDWKAKWVGLDRAVGTDNAKTTFKRVLSARMLRKEFETGKEIKAATAFVSGLGLFEMYINGKKIGDQVLAPGLTEYNKKAFYMAFDVTENLVKGDNAIGLVLGNGRFFAPRGNVPTLTRTYGFPKAICQIEIEFTDGTKATVVSDETWKLTTDGPIRKNNEYDGEYYDARKEIPGWNKTGFNDSKWMKAELVDKPGETLINQPSEPIKIMEELKPVSVKEIKSGVYIFDMGQNMVGWIELFVKGKRGDKVQLRFAERLNGDGTLFMDNLRSAEVTDTYILKGVGEEQWEPSFTYHGFQYVEMTGYPGKPTIDAIRGKVVYDGIDDTGNFTCSNEMINSIYKNAYWGIRGNYRSMPTDCPQRDERQGWLGDRSAECTGESYIFNISNLYSKWIDDMRDAQREDGSIADVAPSYWPTYSDNTTWPGTYLFATDMLYTQYGDLKAVEINYPFMQKWMKHMEQYVKDGIMTRDTYGDWCSPPADPKLIHTVDPLRTTSSEYIGTTYFYAEYKLMAKFATLLGKSQDAEEYLKKAAAMKEAFNRYFFDKNNAQYSNNSHTVNILALTFDLVPDEHKKQIEERLLEKILGESNEHVGNGIVGGQWLMRTLTSTGHADVAYTLAAQHTYPSWGYMVEKGATTIWELWNGDTGDPGMNSGNHVMLLGDLIIWLYEDLAGIKANPEIPAFKHTVMKPNVVGDLTFVDASYKSIYGKIKSSWKTEDGKFSWDITIPANTTATIYVPVLKDESEVQESGKKATGAEGVEFVKMEGDRAVFRIVSGTYSFTSDGARKSRTAKYTTTPIISPKDTVLAKGDKIAVSINCSDESSVIYYTLDGKNPDETSAIYKEPIVISGKTTVKARAYKKGDNPSMQTIAIYDFIDREKNGVTWNVYRGDFKKMPDFSKMKPKFSGTTYSFSLNKDVKTPERFFGLRFKSKIKIDKTGLYKFYTSSNDGSKLYVDGKLIVDNDGLHGPVQKSGTVQLTKGLHDIMVDYFQGGGSKVLMVFYSSEDVEYRPIPGSVLFK